MFPRAIRGLQGLQYIPNFRTSLNSLGALESFGMRIILKKENLKICYGAFGVKEGSWQKNVLFNEIMLELSGYDSPQLNGENLCSFKLNGWALKNVFTRYVKLDDHGFKYWKEISRGGF